MNRREAFGSLALGGAGLLVAAIGSGSSQPAATRAADPAPAAAPPAASPLAVGRHLAKPLPFDPKKLTGLSERLIVSHHDNNYAGAVKNLNAVEEDLARLTRETPGYLVAGLKERELTFTNSVILHEAYFGNLGGDGRAGGPIQKDLDSAHGSFQRWEEGFRGIGMSLSGGSGWAILDLNLQTGELRSYWAGNHTQSLVAGYPLLVLDMYEHAYQIDFGAAAARYVDAFFQNIHWDEVNRRLERGRRAATTLAS